MYHLKHLKQPKSFEMVKRGTYSNEGCWDAEGDTNVTLDLSLLICHSRHLTIDMSLLTFLFFVTFDKSLLIHHSVYVTVDMSILIFLGSLLPQYITLSVSFVSSKNVVHF